MDHCLFFVRSLVVIKKDDAHFIHQRNRNQLIKSALRCAPCPRPPRSSRVLWCGVVLDALAGLLRSDRVPFPSH